MGRLLGVPSSRGRKETVPRCQLWGVVNVTPDSFSDGGRFLAPERALAHARQLLRDGADVIDVGGASSRPRGTHYGQGAAHVPADEECARVLPVVAAIAREGAVVSIDTTEATVARAALAAGAKVVNDVSCGRSLQLLDAVAEVGAEYVLMHTRGQGEVEPPNTVYDDVVSDVRDELLAAVARAEQRGITRDKIWLDPGIGFAKTAAQSVALLSSAHVFVATGLRVLYGPSRKGFIAELCELPSGERPGPSAREPGTLAAVTAAVLQGVTAVRVHDVAAARQAVRLAEAIRSHRWHRAGASRRRDVGAGRS